MLNKQVYYEMNRNIDASGVRKFDDYGFAMASSTAARDVGGGGEEDGRWHRYSPLKSAPTVRQQWKTMMNDHGSTDLDSDPILKKKLWHMLKDGGHHFMRGEIWRWFLGTSQTRSENKFDYMEEIAALHCKMKKYGISDLSSEENIRRINSLLDTRAVAKVCVSSRCVEGEGEREGAGGGEGEEGSVNYGEVEEEVKGSGEREEDKMEIDGKKGRVVAEEEDRELLSVSRQIMLDINRTFPTHQLFCCEADTKLCLFRVLIMYSQYNTTVGYCQGMAYIAAVLLMNMAHEEDVFWALVTLFDSKKYLTGFYDIKLSRIQSCASIFSLMLRDRQPQLAKHLDSLSIHPLMYMTSWFMCLFTTLPCWDTVLTICDLVFLEGYEILFRAGMAVMEVCSAELLAMDTMDTVLTFIQKPPSRLMSYRVLVPILWRTSIVRSEVEWYRDVIVQDTSSRPLKRSAPLAEIKTPSKRRKLAGDGISSTPVVQSFLSRLVTVLTPASWQLPHPLPHPQDTTAPNNPITAKPAVSDTPQRSSEHTSVVRRRAQTEGRKRGKRERGIVSSSRKDLTAHHHSSLARSNRKRKRDDLENFGGQIANGGMIEMKQFSKRTQTLFPPSPHNQPSSPSLPLFLSPSLPPPFCLSPSPASSKPILQETPSFVLGISPANQVTVNSPSINTPSPLRRSRRLAKLRGQSSHRGHPSPAPASPSVCPVQGMLFSSGCDSEERKAFQSFTAPTPLRCSQVSSGRESCSDTLT